MCSSTRALFDGLDSLRSIGKGPYRRGISGRPFVGNISKKNFNFLGISYYKIPRFSCETFQFFIFKNVAKFFISGNITSNTNGWNRFQSLSINLGCLRTAPLKPQKLKEIASLILALTLRVLSCRKEDTLINWQFYRFSGLRAVKRRSKFRVFHVGWKGRNKRHYISKDGSITQLPNKNELIENEIMLVSVLYRVECAFQRMF